MGYRTLSLNLPTDYDTDQLQRKIAKRLRLQSFTWQIERQSLDARKKTNIHWQMRVAVVSDELKDGEPPVSPTLDIPYRKRKEKVVIVGSGPAGLFSALVLQKAGFQTTLIDRGAKVDKRAEELATFERIGQFSPVSNYAFGEGGAGTFSDGKLTSRTKNITAEKDFMISNYIDAGAPAEIGYLAHPHIGTDRLRVVVANLRNRLQSMGGTVLFETLLENLVVRNGRIREGVTSRGTFPTDLCIVAPGHSAYDTYRMLMKRGVPFRTKPFAVGCRVEHPQALINLAQWGTDNLPGLKAAEYRLTSRAADRSVYTFCMCPGGTVVPATAYTGSNIVNGMSYYARNGQFANAACVAGIHGDEVLGHKASPQDVLQWLADLEGRFYDYSGGYSAPGCTILDFLKGHGPASVGPSSYPLGVVAAPLWEMLPLQVVTALRKGLLDFQNKLKGFENGILLGLESKTSSPIQVLRDQSGLCEGFDNLFVVGEGSGYAGGIISSGVDGIRVAGRVIEYYL